MNVLENLRKLQILLPKMKMLMYAKCEEAKMSSLFDVTLLSSFDLLELLLYPRILSRPHISHDCAKCYYRYFIFSALNLLNARNQDFTWVSSHILVHVNLFIHFIILAHKYSTDPLNSRNYNTISKRRDANCQSIISSLFFCEGFSSWNCGL